MISSASLSNLLLQISKDYKLDENELKSKYMNFLEDSSKKKKILCKARKADGLQCTRRCKNGNIFCGKHINNRKWGCFTDNNSTIELKIFTYSNKEYYVDDFNIVYDRLEQNSEKFRIIGRKNNNIIEYCEQLNSLSSNIDA